MWLDQTPPPAIEQTARAPAERSGTEIHYGGPDRPAGALRDLLKARIEAAPPGSEITWATYYFRDQDLADSLVAAHRRGVRVRILLEGRPRRGRANEHVIETLQAGLGDNLRLHRSLFGAHLHAKIYAFSGPRPEVLIGSFNPSGDRTPNPKLLADIGDQDRGQNLLVAFREPLVARALQRHAARMWKGKAGFRFGKRENRAADFQAARLYYFPRLRPDVVERRIARLGKGDRVQAAISHMDDGPFARQLAQAAARGAEIDVVVHDASSRVPNGVVRGLDRAGVNIRRYCDPEGLPMHAKFVLIDRGGVRSAWFGSLNYTVTSRLLNQEILARSTDAGVVDDLEGRFRLIAEDADARASCDPGRRMAAQDAAATARPTVDPPSGQPAGQ